MAFLTELTEKRIREQEVKDYCASVFKGKEFKIYKENQYFDGSFSYFVFIPTYSWLKSTKYDWYEVKKENNSYTHKEIEAVC